MQWQIQHQLESKKTLDDIKEILFTNRDLISSTDQEQFLHPPHPNTLSPEEVGLDADQIDRTIERIRQAIENQENIVIYGDYDADGVCATAILWQTLYLMKAKVMPFIPDREKHGYGLSEAGINEILAKHQPELVITVDNGIVALESAALLKNQGVDLIITDHHQANDQLPEAVSIIHSTQICGSGVSWFLARSLLLVLDPVRVEARADALLDLVGIGTIADLMPMIGVNRSLAKFGLDKLTHTKRPGLVAMKTEAGITPETSINTYHVGYVIGPRINAMGRVDSGLEALRLLCTNNRSTAARLAETLGRVNKKRQDMTGLAMEAAEAIYESSPDLQKQSIIVIASPMFHEGIIGLVAGKLTEKYHKPSIVIAQSSQISKGSARSVSGVNIIELIRSVPEHLLGAGGHPGAAGLSLKTEHIPLFTKDIEQAAAEHIDPKLLEKSLRVELELPLDKVSFDLLAVIEEFAPFGIGNPRPILASPVEVVDYRLIGKQQDHLKLTVGMNNQESIFVESIGFGMASSVQVIEEHNLVKLAYTLDRNDWNGRSSLQLVLKDIITFQN